MDVILKLIIGCAITFLFFIFICILMYVIGKIEKFLKSKFKIKNNVEEYEKNKFWKTIEIVCGICLFLLLFYDIGDQII